MIMIRKISLRNRTLQYFLIFTGLCSIVFLVNYFLAKNSIYPKTNHSYSEKNYNHNFERQNVYKIELENDRRDDFQTEIILGTFFLDTINYVTGIFRRLKIYF